MTALEIVKALVKLGEKATAGWARDRSLVDRYGVVGGVKDAKDYSIAGNGRGGNNAEFLAEQERNLDFIEAAGKARPALAALVAEIENLRAEIEGMHEDAAGEDI